MAGRLYPEKFPTTCISMVQLARAISRLFRANHSPLRSKSHAPPGAPCKPFFVLDLLFDLSLHLRRKRTHLEVSGQNRKHVPSVPCDYLCCRVEVNHKGSLVRHASPAFELRGLVSRVSAPSLMQVCSAAKLDSGAANQVHILVLLRRALEPAAEVMQILSGGSSSCSSGSKLASSRAIR